MKHFSEIKKEAIRRQQVDLNLNISTGPTEELSSSWQLNKESQRNGA